jgi:hypothetical protein
VTRRGASRAGSAGALVLLLAGSILEAQPAPPRGPLAIRHVTVIDVSTGNRLPDRTIFVADGRIARIDSGSPARDAGLEVDGRGKFVIPGLWDLHAHLTPFGESGMALLIANGATGVRDMGGPIDRLTGWRARIEEGTLVGPRIRLSGPMIDGLRRMPGFPGMKLIASNAAEARVAVDSLRRLGVDFVKLHWVTREVYLAAAAEARAVGLAFAGHAPLDATLDEIVATGPRSIEHESGLAIAASPNGPAILRWVVDSLAGLVRSGTADGWLLIQLSIAADSMAREGYPGGRPLPVYRQMVRAGVFATPTLVTIRAYFRRGDPALRTDPRFRFIPASLLRELDLVSPDSVLSPDERTRRERDFASTRADFRAMHDAGVGFLSGTDMGVFGIFPGFSLHDELGLLTEVGLSPLEAIQAATRSAGLAFGSPDIGVIAAGARADLVLLDADPLTAIGNTTRIRAVVADGRWYDRAALDRLLERAEVAARSGR